MPTNINTDDYDLYGSDGYTTPLQGSPYIDEQGHPIYDEPFFVNSNPNSTMDPGEGTGVTTDFWTNYPISIDVNGNILYHGENTGVNVRGPAGLTSIAWEDLTQAQRDELRGQDGNDGVPGRDGADGQDGQDGLSAYGVWAVENGYNPSDESHLEEFYAYIASFINPLIRIGQGTDSITVSVNSTANIASGEASLATGFSSTAAGDYSFTAGLGTKAPNAAMTAIGKYNEGKTGNIFEVGNGSALVPFNLLELDSTGTLTVPVDFVTTTDRLSNKVNKEVGKGLSTNDFTNEYKSFIDNYHIDSVVTSLSNNPVQNSAVAAAIAHLAMEQPTVGIDEATLDKDYPIMVPYSTTEAVVSKVQYSNKIKFNPFQNNLFTQNCAIPASYSNCLLYGKNLIAYNSDQIIFGKYNAGSTASAFQIGYGTTAANRNILDLSFDGDLTVAGEITDGNGISLSDKQDVLTFDNEPTALSTNPVTSDGIYQYINDAITEPFGIFSHRLDVAEDNIENVADNLAEATSFIASSFSTLDTNVTSSFAAVNSTISTIDTYISSHLSLTDDITGKEYKLGISNGQLYAQEIVSTASTESV